MVRRFAVVAALVFAAVAFADPPVESEQYGTKRIDFTIASSRAFLIQPTKPANDGSRPWIWYAPTFIGGHPDPSHTWMAEQWLAAGFAIAGIEVGESYGSPEGTRKYGALYDHVTTTYELDPKPCLLPQSRGGLMLLNWAIENPKKVACIAGIYTVCDITSYPGIDRAAPAYDLSPERLKASLARYNPVERAEVFANAKIPMLFIHGNSDKVVPIEKNAGELVDRVNAANGNAKLIAVPGKGHEVCPEFFQSRELTDFVLARGQSK